MRLNTRFELRLHESEINRWKAAADAMGMKLSEWIRRVCNLHSHPKSEK